MPAYTVVEIADVPDSAEAVGMPPELFEIRFMRQMLGLENFSMTFERFRGGCHGRPHRHSVQEEVYLLVSGRAQGKFGDDVIDLEPWTAVRVPPATARAFRNTGDEDAVFLVIAAPQAGPDDAVGIDQFWMD